MSRVNCGSAVTLLDGVLVVAVITHRPETLVSKLVFLGLGLLDADDIGILLCHPLKKALSGRRTNAVGIQTDYAKQKKYSNRSGNVFSQELTTLYVKKLPNPCVILNGHFRRMSFIQRLAESEP